MRDNNKVEGTGTLGQAPPLPEVPPEVQATIGKMLGGVKPQPHHLMLRLEVEKKIVEGQLQMATELLQVLGKYQENSSMKIRLLDKDIADLRVQVQQAKKPADPGE